MSVLRAFVEVNHGRWIVECPAPGCLCAEHLNGKGFDGKTFHCSECHHESVVSWPEDRAEIEAALGRRELANQNWKPGETVADLIAENIERGVT